MTRLVGDVDRLTAGNDVVVRQIRAEWQGAALSPSQHHAAEREARVYARVPDRIEVAVMHPPFVLIGALHAAPALPLLEKLDGVPGE